MELTKGLYKDSRSSKMPDGTWIRAKNILLSKGFKSVSPEDGFTLGTTLDDWGSIVGIIPTTSKKVIFSTDHVTSFIGYISNDSSTYTQVAADTFFDFSLQHPIEGVFKVNNKGETIVIWTDFNNEIRFLNIDNPPATITNVNTLLSPDLTNPIYTLNLEEAKGSCKVGHYNFFCQYESEGGNTTKWLNSSKPIFVTKDQISVGYDQFSGSDTLVTNKAISISLTNVDTNFKYLKIAVISTISGVKTAAVILKLTITSDTLNTKYTGTELIDDSLSLEEILIPTTTYTKCKTLTQLNQKLYIGNLIGIPNINYQKYANNIKINWQTQNKQPLVLNNGSSKTVDLNHTDRGFLHREVYSFYIVFKLKKGGYSPAFHIPGRRAVTGEKAVSTLTDTGFSTNPLVYEIEDTVDSTLGTTNMGYYENKDEFYPLNAGADPNGDFEVWDASGQIDDLYGENVRHHRFPSIDYIANNGGYDPALYRVSESDVLGIDVSDVYIPNEIKDLIDGWEIFYAQRDYDNCTVLGQDFSILAGKDDTAPNLRYNKGINYDFFDGALPPPRTAGMICDSHFNYLQCRSLDILKNKPTIVPSYIANELHYRYITTRLRSVYDSGTNKYEFESMIIDLTGSYGDTVNTFNPVDSKKIRKVIDRRYVAANTFANDIDNFLGDEYLEVQIESSTNIHVINNLGFSWNTFGSPPAISDTTTNLYSLMALRDNIYKDFNNYFQLVGTGVTFDKDDVTGTFIFGGDIFVSDNSTMRYGRTFTDYTRVEANCVGLNHVVRGILETTNNWSLRHLDDTDEYTWYYPKKTSTPQDGVMPNIDTTNPLKILYNDDFTAIKNLDLVETYNYVLQQTNQFKYRIAEGTAQNKETDSSFGKFLANNYYDMPSDKGEVWALNRLGNALMINQTNSFYIARVKDKLATSVQEIYVGTGDVFDRPPDETISTPLGYAGCQSQWGTNVSKHGYAFVDRETGKVFLFNGQIKELSAKGLYYEFFNKLQTTLKDVDNPFSSNGITMTFDSKYNRLIVSKKDYVWKGGNVDTVEYDAEYEADTILTDGTNYFTVVANKVADSVYDPNEVLITVGLGTVPGFLEVIEHNNTFYYTNNSMTLSYSFDFDCWVCNHDYVPDYMFYNRQNAFAIKNRGVGMIYEFNSNLTKGTYIYQDITFKSYIDTVFIFPKPVILNAVKWDSNMIGNDGLAYENLTLTHLMIYTKNQCSGVFALSQLSTTRSGKTLLRDTDRVWSANNFRDMIKDNTIPFLDSKDEVDTDALNLNKPFYKKSIFLDTNFVIRFIYDNIVGVTPKTLYLNDVNVLVNESNVDY